MGRNYDPITLHKYLYTHADPVNNTDPTGNYTLSGLSTAISIRGILTVASRTHAGMSWMNTILNADPAEFDARAVGAQILINMLGGQAFKAIGLFGSKLLSRSKSLGCNKNSFEAGTLVHTENGLIPIEEIEIGDYVWSEDIDTGEKELQLVTHLIRGENSYVLVEIEFSNGETITATDEHPFYVDGHWVRASSLAADDNVLLLGEAKNAQIRSVSHRIEYTKVYNLTVEMNHNFAVGRSAYLVHNSSPVCIFDPATRNLEKVSPKLAQKVRGYPANTDVYLGFSGSEVVYVGISGDVNSRRKQHQNSGRNFVITKITPVKLPRPLARAIEQAVIEKYGLAKNGGLQNKINSISELQGWRKEAIEWGQKWITNNKIPGL